MASGLTIGSLFAGIGGLELGLERAGHGPVIWQAESDLFCRRVLEKHWPGVKRFEDVRQVTRAAPKPDIICGGFPCVDISSAGKKLGIEGEHSGLWREFARIIRELRPRFVVVENTAALLHRGMGDVLGNLASIGYDAQWERIFACSIGAPQPRPRVFILAHLNGHSEPDGSEYVKAPIVQEDSRAPWKWPDPATIRRMDDGVQDRSHRLRALGNAVVPQVAEVVGGWINELERSA